jgi:protein involved in polysaccharide export with SLBB domain
MYPNPLRISPLLVLALLFFLSTSSPAQVPEKEEDQRVGDVRRPVVDEQEAARRPALGLDLRIQALEAPVDPQSYIIGPGDEFLIAVQSAVESNFRIAVTPEGKLIIPTIGTLRVDGKSLAEVQRMVREAGSKKYLHTNIAANLVSLRSFRVHVTGQVMNPGLYTALAVDRVSDIIEVAGGLTPWAYERAIEVRHLDGSKDTVDLHQYKRLGRLEANIYLRAGDVVFVPPIDLSQATVRVEGRTYSRGLFQLGENESLEDFLLRVGAFNQRADLSGAFIERRKGPGEKPEIIPIISYLKQQGNGYSKIRLQDGDLIMVPEKLDQVYVIGAVKNPGPYTYIPNLKVRDYVGLAGGTERAVRLSKARIVRRGSGNEEVGQDLLVHPGDTIYVPEKVKFGVTEVFGIIGQVTGIIIALKAVGVIK